MQVSGRTVLITGGSSGIGLGLAKRFRALGNTVIITGRSQDKLDAAQAQLPGIHTHRSDVSKAEDVASLAARIRSDFPTLDLLINNAGVFRFQNLATPSDDLEALTAELDINVAGPIRTTSALVDLLAANQGAVVNVSSGLAFVPMQAAPIYCATKAALHSYTVSLRQQLRGKVEVVELMPPATRTPMTQELSDDSGFDMMDLRAMLDSTFKGLRAGAEEIRPGQSNQLYWMARLAPGFIQRQLERGSASMVPVN
jgi:uncharacterized oxidoreductase